MYNNSNTIINSGKMAAFGGTNTRRDMNIQAHKVTNELMRKEIEKERIEKERIEKERKEIERKEIEKEIETLKRYNERKLLDITKQEEAIRREVREYEISTSTSKKDMLKETIGNRKQITKKDKIDVRKTGHKIYALTIKAFQCGSYTMNKNDSSIKKCGRSI